MSRHPISHFNCVPSAAAHLLLVHGLTYLISGLQTPRLKRLAEIVSAQALAQQERLEYDDEEELEGSEQEEADGMSTVDEGGLPVSQ